MGLLALTQYPWNRLDPSGAFLLDALVPFDTAFHVGLARELAIGYPPQLPGVSGFPLGYHLGTDLVRAAALRWAGIDPFDSISRFDVTLHGLALMLVLRATAARLGARPIVVALAPLTLLATDFSFVFAALPRRPLVGRPAPGQRPPVPGGRESDRPRPVAGSRLADRPLPI